MPELNFKRRLLATKIARKTRESNCLIRSFVTCLAILFFPAGQSHLAYSQSAVAAGDRDNGYRLVWSDEFDQAGVPDPKKWSFEQGFVRNQELQWYQRSNATCQDGVLLIEAKRERIPNPAYQAAATSWKQNRQYAEFTSACLTTQRTQCWTYGRFEIRARIDAREGLWPAIWTVGEAGDWPACGEIDLMEFYQGHILANACWSNGKKWQPKWDSSAKPLSYFGGAAWAARFHIWRLNWDAQSLKLFLDDRLLNTIDVSQTIKGSNQEISPFHQPHYLLLNLAVGGTKGGDPTGTEFPGMFEIDYVRIYQR